MAFEIRKKSEFTAVDAAGSEFAVIIFARYEKIHTRGSTHEVEGVNSLRLLDGTNVNRIEKGKYRTASGFSDFDLTSDDPNAP